MSDHIEYADWGERFFRSAVSAERVLAGINVLAGQQIDVGPMGVGPGPGRQGDRARRDRHARSASGSPTPP